MLIAVSKASLKCDVLAYRYTADFIFNFVSWDFKLLFMYIDQEGGLRKETPAK